MPLIVVLSVGLDHKLLETRNLVLQAAGYTIVTAFSAKEAAARVQDGDFDLVLLCRSIPPQERERLTIRIRASGSRIPVVLVSGDPREWDASSNALVDSDPKALLAGMEEVLTRAATPDARVTAHEKPEVTVVRGKKPPTSSTGHEQESRTNKEPSVPFAHAG